MARFVVEHAGVEHASVVFGRAEIFERKPTEYAVARLRWADGHVDAVLSLVDVANHPMMAAMRRSGADPTTHPWHKWLYASGSP